MKIFWKVFKRVNGDQAPKFKGLNLDGKIFAQPRLVNHEIRKWGEEKWRAPDIGDIEKEIENLRQLFIVPKKRLLWKEPDIFEALMNIKDGTAPGIDMIDISKFQTRRTWAELVQGEFKED